METSEPTAHIHTRRLLHVTIDSSPLRSLFLCAYASGARDHGDAAYGGDGCPWEGVVVGTEGTVEGQVYRATRNMHDLPKQIVKHKVEEDLLVAMGGEKPTGFLPLGTALEALETLVS